MFQRILGTSFGISLLLLLCGASSLLPQSADAQGRGCANTVEPKLQQQFQAALDAKKKEAKPIYGCDDRRNFYDPKLTEHQKKAARATAVMVTREQLKSTDAAKTTFALETEAGRTKLCSPQETVAQGFLAPERFWDEPSPGSCSAFKVGKRLMATAGHCIKTEAQCGASSFVFGFHMTSGEDEPDRGIKGERVYHCAKIVAGPQPGESDWRIVEVDRDIDAPEVAIRTKTTKPALKKGTGLTVVGYPMGLPVKIADGALVSEIRPRSLKANLDTYEGNSGSVVLNSEKLSKGELLAEGILVSGETDYVLEQPCRLSKHCPANGCRREEVTLTSEFAGALGKK